MTANLSADDQGVSRRTLAKGVGWSVPAIMVAAAAPAYAISSLPPTMTYKEACKWPGSSCTGTTDKSYAVTFTVVNNDPNDTIYFCDLTMTNITNGIGTWTSVPPASGCYEVAAGGTRDVTFRFDNSTDSANLTFDATVTFNWGHNCPCSADPYHHPAITQQIHVNDTKPHGACTCPPPA